MSGIAPWVELRGTRTALIKLKEIGRKDLTEFEKKAIGFCLDWQNGRRAFGITTSGSTGTPKAITLLRGQMNASAERTASALGLRAGMTALVCLDTSFIAGMMMLVRSMVTGMNMIITEPSANPLKDIPPSKVDFIALVPYQLGAMLRSEHRDRLASVGTIILGGAAVGTDLLREVSGLPAHCYATFGMTETLSHIALQRLNGNEKEENFHTLDGVSITQDDRGCLVIRADYLSEPIVTNDLVEIKNPREFAWLGRYDNIINSGGIKITPEKIENAIGDWLQREKISNRFFVTGIPHPQLGQQVTLVIEGTLSNKDEHALLTSLQRSLTKYEVPGRILYKNHFIETKSGKIDRRASLS